MAQLSWPNNRVDTPHAVDSLGDGSRTDELTALKGSYQNSAYENSKIAHQYKDPSLPAAKVLSIRGRARRLKKSDEQENHSDVDLDCDPWLSRLILFLILIVSLTLLLLVVLIILSKVELSCSYNEDAEQDHVRVRRGFRSYYYNYLDEIAMATCAAIPSNGPGVIYAVRRTCGEIPDCKNICTQNQLRQQAPAEIRNLTWDCTESLHVYKRQPALSDNYDNYTDSHKLGLAVFRYYSCTVSKCGPNYCCCRAVAL